MISPTGQTSQLQAAYLHVAAPRAENHAQGLTRGTVQLQPLACSRTCQQQRTHMVPSAGNACNSLALLLDALKCGADIRHKIALPKFTSQKSQKLGRCSNATVDQTAGESKCQRRYRCGSIGGEATDCEVGNASGEPLQACNIKTRLVLHMDMITDCQWGIISCRPM